MRNEYPWMERRISFSPDAKFELVSKLATHRRNSGITQAGLAYFAGVSIRSLQRIEVGTQKPRTVLALKLAKILNCPVEDIFELSRPEYP